MRAAPFAALFLTLLPLSLHAAPVSVVPENFLRPWDPVTFFFADAVGPKKPGPEDHPEKFLKMSPAHPGAYSWVDSSTLIFRPAEPWPALARFDFKLKNQSFRRSTLMSAPLNLSPADGETGLESVSSLSLTFPEPLPPDALAKMVRVELRPLPGTGQKELRVLRREELEIKQMDRPSRSDPATYVISFAGAIPLGTRATIRFQLSLDDQSEESFFETSFSTSELFRVSAFGCRGKRYPVTADGSKYREDQAIRCSSESRSVEIELSTEPGAIDLVAARNLLRISPHVEDLEVSRSGRVLYLSGNFAFDQTYKIALHPVPLVDVQGRPLQPAKISELYLYYPKRPNFLQVSSAQGMLERFGPKSIPLQGRGFTRLDLRIYPLDPLDLDFWPFGSSPISVDESQRPPGPGEEPDKRTELASSSTPEVLSKHLAMLGPPPLSRIVELPLKETKSAATFGLDLQDYLSTLSGKNNPGHYLIGLRRLDGSTERAWMRVQVTDLSLTTLEGRSSARLLVTRLSDGTPVAGAEVMVEGRRDSFVGPLFTGKTDARGFVDYPLDSHTQPMRISVKHERDALVLDINRPPAKFRDNRWIDGEYEEEGLWLSSSHGSSSSSKRTLCHLYSERTVYRPNEVVHFGGWVRSRSAGRLLNDQANSSKIRLLISGPGNTNFTHALSLGELGGFHHEFSEKELPTGEYQARLEGNYLNPILESCWMSFRVEAYRIPTFEIRLHGPQETPMDREVAVKLTAGYYAGGPVSSRPVRWRVTQFPYDWTPPSSAFSGFNYSTDARWSRRMRFDSGTASTKETETDESGAGQIMLNPSIEATAQPRTYVVEATVTGDDEQTVTATHRTHAVPAFVLGLKVPRFLERAQTIEPQLIVLSPKGDLIQGTEVTVRLIHRAWHSHLIAGDFTQGAAKYVTDVVEKKIHEEKLLTGPGINKLSLAVPEAGVYLVELEARDRLGRAQVVTVDLYAGGDRPVSWAKPENGVFAVKTDKSKYLPGETATFLLESPYRTARALAVVETPDGNEYSWIDVKGGSASFKLKLEPNYVPRIPVHFILMRGRVDTSGNARPVSTDLGKPSTLASTNYVEVEPSENKVTLALDYPKKARPGDEITVELELRKYSPDKKGTLISGEVDLWLVDQAVLALGKEQSLDPLASFITDVEAGFYFHDTRGAVFGKLPLQETPGGDGDSGRNQDLLDRTTVRKKFSSVPYFQHGIKIGPSGKASVKITLPDNLTNFMVRAKAVSGADRFGFATGQISVRLPLVVQPALPRFVRAEDRVQGGIVARVVEGNGGAANVQLKIEGARLEKAVPATVNLEKTAAVRGNYEFVVHTPKKYSGAEVTIAAAVERKSDRAKDAVETKLSLLPDLEPIRRREMFNVDEEHPLKISALTEETRAGTVRRTLLISDRDALVRMAAGLNFLLEFPYGATEHRISRAQAMLAMSKFAELLHLEDQQKHTQRALRDALEWLPQVVSSEGLAAYWPGGRGYVSLTAWTVEFMTAAKAAGYDVDDKLYARMIAALEGSLRADARNLLSGGEWSERVYALRALNAAGRTRAGDAAELARKSNYLDLESTASVVRVLSERGQAKSAAVKQLENTLWNGVVFRSHQGQKIYGGLQDSSMARPAELLSSETRTLAELANALTASGHPSADVELLYNALITLGRGDGWGSTNANAAALQALSARIETKSLSAKTVEVKIYAGNKSKTLELNARSPVIFFETEASGELRVETESEKPLTVRVESEYVPITGGRSAPASAQGFVVTRRLLQIFEDGSEPAKHELATPGTILSFGPGTLIEDHVTVINPADRAQVAVVIPFAAGLEPMNPNLETAPPEARTRGTNTLSPTYSTYLDDRAAHYYDRLPKGTYHFYVRTRAVSGGVYTQPPASAELMADRAVQGRSPGAAVNISNP